MSIKCQDYIEERKEVMMGKPVFKGTRLTVEHLLQELGTGMSPAEVLENYPTLKTQNRTSSGGHAVRGSCRSDGREHLPITGSFA